MTTIVKPYSRVYTSDRVLEDMQNQIENTFTPFTSAAILDGILYENKTLTAAVENLLEHGLGRAYRGWIITDQDQACHIYRYTSSTADAKKFLPLVSTATVNVGIWVF
jgi:hypothetical protein